MKTPLRYAGGKSRAIKSITPFITGNQKIVSPFLGGGSMEVYWASLGIKVYGYDIFDALVNFWQVLLSSPNQLADKLSDINPTQDEYKRVKEILLDWDNTQKLLSDWKTDYYKRDKVIKLDDLTAAAYYFFNHNTSYGPGYLGWGSNVYLTPTKWEGMIKNIRNFKLDNLIVEHSSFEDVIENNQNEFLYLDPPYFLDKDGDNKMFTGIYPMRNIPVHHEGFNHEKLRDLLHNHKDNFVLSYNNCETIREYYKDFELFYPKWSYSMGNGEKRVGKNRIEMGITNTKESHEILIVKR